MAQVPNYHVLRIKYLGPTNSRGSRVKIISDRFKQSVTIPFDHALNNIEDMAEAYLVGLGFNIIGHAEGYIITDTFRAFRRIVYVVQGHYGKGWEDVTEADTKAEARQYLKDYNANEPQPHRLITRKETANP